MTNTTPDPNAAAMADWLRLWAPDGKVPAGDEEPALSALIEAMSAGGVSRKGARAACSRVQDMCEVRIDEVRIGAWLEAAYGKNGSEPPSPTSNGKTSDAAVVKLHTFKEILEWPEPAWLIDDIIEEGALHLLYGARSSFKSFVVADWLMAIATGTPWFDHEVPAARAVIFVCSEGGRGLGRRFRAWHFDRQGKVDDVPLLRVLAAPLLVAQAPRMAAFRDAVRREVDVMGQAPAVLALDTAARCMAGLDENSNRDMGIFIETVDSCRREFGAAGLLVHHSGWDTRHERGASSLGAGVDHVLRAERLAGPGFRCAVHCEKAKDSSDDGDLAIGLRLCAYGNGKHENSLVVASANTLTPESIGAVGELQTLEVHSQHSSHGALSCAAWKRVAVEVLGISEATFYRHVNRLERRDFVEKGEGARAPYVLTAAGREALSEEG